MKLLNMSMIIFMLLGCAKQKDIISEKKSASAVNPTVSPMALSETWDLIFSDEFNTTGAFNTNKWTHSTRWHPAWAKYLTSTPEYASVNGSSLVLKMDNAVIPGDDVPYHSGGIQTTTKFSFTYGKVEVRAKFKQGQGSWPAIWMMPEDPVSFGDWPNSGEIDIMEHVNYENVVHQTIHNGAVTGSGGGSSASRTSAYNVTDFNTYTMIWNPTSIEFYVNDVLRYTYNKVANATSMQWPFDKPFYLILNQSGGAGWPGAINNADLPFSMEVDYVRVYKQAELESGANYKIISALNNSSLLDVNAAGTVNATPVILWPNTTPSSLNQQWKVTNVGGGYYKLSPLHALTKALDVKDAGTAAGTKIQIYDDNSTVAQKWQIKSVGGEYFVITPGNAPSKQLEVTGGSTTNGTTIQIAAPNLTNSQKFKFVKQ